MSRLIVKNLPDYTTPSSLKSHFQQKGCPPGLITDIKVALKQDGTSRRFGFVGYKTAKEAEKAKDWFDKTFIGGSRINVAVVDGAKDAPAPRPNKRRRLSPTPTQNVASTSAPTRKPKDKETGQLDEFVQVMNPKKLPSWANEAQAQPEIHVVEDEEPPPQALSDLDWMKSRVSTALDSTERAFEQSDDEENGKQREQVRPHKSTLAAPYTFLQPETVVSQPKDPVRETILQTARLFARNLAYSCTEDELRELFEPFGKLEQVRNVSIRL